MGSVGEEGGNGRGRECASEHGGVGGILIFFEGFKIPRLLLLLHSQKGGCAYATCTLSGSSLECAYALSIGDLLQVPQVPELSQWWPLLNFMEVWQCQSENIAFLCHVFSADDFLDCSLFKV